MIHEVRDFTIEFPTMMNGHLAENSFFVVPKLEGRSQFGIFYGDGRYATDFPEAMPQYVHNYLRKMAKNHVYIPVGGSQ
jgi:hypothetical protein